MNKEYKIQLSEFSHKKLIDLAIAIGISEEDLIKQAVFNYIIQF